MIEIVLGIWLVAFLLSAIVSGFNIHVVRRHLNSHKLQTLNSNLAKAQLYWSYSHSNFELLQEGVIQQDKEKALRHAFYFSLLGLLSIPGFILLLGTFLGMHFLAKSRKEIAVFESDLTQNPALTSEQVQALIAELNCVQ